MRKSEGKAAADRGWLAMTQQSTIGTCLHICEESCGASAAPKDVAKAKNFHFSPHIGPSAAYAGLENRQDMARYGILGQKGFKSSDQRINHVGMDQERSNTERMRGFGTILL